MESILDTSKGLHIDFHPISQPQGTYRYLLNAIREASGAILNEKGTTNLTSVVGTLGTVVGHCVLDEEIITCCVRGNTSEIGVLTKDNTYTVKLENSGLNFSVDRHVDIVARKNFKGNRIIYFADGANVRFLNLDNATLLASPTILQDTKLILNPKIGEVYLDSVGNDGNVPTGVYQFAVRFITSTGNRTPFGFVSPLISIVDETYQGSWTNIDGAIPQSVTNKSITLTLDNLDKSFPYYEVVMVTYVGIENTQKAVIVGTGQISDVTRSFTYRGTDQHKEIVDIEEIVIKPVIYDSATCVEQKDNRLILSNLTASAESTSFQRVANAVKVRYEIEEIDYYPAYKDPNIIAEKKGYRRDEVYSFAIAPVFKTSQNTIAYHIPAPFNYLYNPLTGGDRKVPPTYLQEGTQLGSYVSDEEYPLDQDYPTENSIRVHHHVMPTVAQEPILSADGLKVRVLGVSFDFSDALPLLSEEQRNNLIGFSVVRQLRVGNDKSILTEGIARCHGQLEGRHYLLPFNGCLNDGVINGSDEHWTPIAFATAQRQLIGFHSAESTILEEDFSTATNIEIVSYLHGTGQIIAIKNDDSTLFNCDVYIGNPLELTVTTFDYTTNTNSHGDYHFFNDADTLSSVIQSGSIAYINPGRGQASLPAASDGLLVSSGWNLDVNFNNGYLFFITNTPVASLSKEYSPAGAGGVYGCPQFLYKGNGDGGGDDIFFDGAVFMGIFMGITTPVNVITPLYRLTRTLSTQYGPVTDAKYVFLRTFTLDELTTSQLVFGGDTFINKVGLTTQEGSNQRNDGGDFLVTHKELHYFWCETSMNVNYRHFNEVSGVEGQDGFIAGTLPYYPRRTAWDGSSNIGVLNYDSSLGHPRGYNTQYSFENNIQYFYPKQFLEEVVTEFSNRSIYSELSYEGEQVDMYRMFLPNNYHDIPRDRGPIVDTFVYKGTFYIHTTGSLYRSFFNEQASQASSIGEVYLGTGGIFERPSIPLYTADGGMAGVQGRWHVTTPFGHFFVDAIQKKIFMFDDGLKDLTEQGIVNFCANILDVTKEYALGYDYANKRVLITECLGDYGDGWTLSYQTLLNSWTGYHTYVPSKYMSNARITYATNDTVLYSLCTGEYGTYFDTVASLILTHVVNENADKSKLFDNVVIFNSVYDATGKHLPLGTFNRLTIRNEEKSTGVCTLSVANSYATTRQYPTLGNIVAVHKNDEIRLDTPIDRLLDNGTLVDTISRRGRIRGKYAEYTWEFDSQNKRFILHTLMTVNRINLR